jgi:glucuronosyltransferase
MRYLIISSIQIFLNIKLLESASILAVYAIDGYSHSIVQRKVLEGLLENGHNITAISTTFMDIQHENFSCALLEDKNDQFLSSFKLKEMSVYNPAELYDREIAKIDALMKTQMANEHIQNLVNDRINNKFDLLILECYTCPLIFLAEIFDCPVVFSSGGEIPSCFQIMLGNYNDEISVNFRDRMKTFFEEMIEFRDQRYLTQEAEKCNSYAANAFPDFEFPSFQKVFENRVKLVQVFLTHTTSIIKKFGPNYHLIGSIHLQSPNKLDEKYEYKKFLDRSVNGVVVMAFGSHSIDLPERIFIKFLKVFEQLPYDVLWKTNVDEFQNLQFPKNILIQKWIQISDILAHPKVKLFISHGGLRSIEETIDREVPMILIPVWYDQPLNAYIMQNHNISMTLNILDFEESTLRSMILEMIKNEYKSNIKVIKRQTIDKISPSVNVSVDNIEQLIKNSEDYYHPYHGRNVGFVVRHNIDLTLIIIAVLLILKFLISSIVKFVQTTLQTQYKKK